MTRCPASVRYLLSKAAIHADAGVTPLGVDALDMPLDDPGRRGEPFDGSNSLLEPPAIFGSPVLELPVEAEIMGPVLRDVGIELGLPADRDEIGLPVLKGCFCPLPLRRT